MTGTPERESLPPIDASRPGSIADVCSLYISDRDGSGLTLAATNGLDQRVAR